MKSKEFCEKLWSVANCYKTLYILGCFGAPMTEQNKERYTHNYPFNEKPERAEKIMNASADTFGFDCVCLVKGILWGWYGDTNKEYGGAIYQSNGVPDVNVNDMLGLCSGVTEDFTKIVPGEYVWVEGHCGIYIGEGRVVECTYRWDDGVQVTKIGNFENSYQSDKVRTWTKHGRLPYVDYEEHYPTIEQLAEKVNESTKNLVNAVLSGEYTTNTQLAYEVIEGLWGDGEVRKVALTKAGYDYRAVQNLVNQILLH